MSDLASPSITQPTEEELLCKQCFVNLTAILTAILSAVYDSEVWWLVAGEPWELHSSESCDDTICIIERSISGLDDAF